MLGQKFWTTHLLRRFRKHSLSERLHDASLPLLPVLSLTYVPLGKFLHSNPALAYGGRSPKTVRCLHTRPVKVFLVEDAPLLRERLEAMLNAIPGVQTVGYAVDAEPAVEGILAAGADAVVLDIQLARGSGFDVLRALQSRAPQIAVYVLTNFATDGYRKAAERLGARGFFDKSHDIPLLREALAASAA